MYFRFIELENTYYICLLATSDAKKKTQQNATKLKLTKKKF